MWVLKRERLKTTETLGKGIMMRIRKPCHFDMISSIQDMLKGKARRVFSDPKSITSNNIVLPFHLF